MPLLVDHGYLCVSLDAPGHGKNREFGEPPAKWTPRGIGSKKKFIPNFSQKISKVFDYLIAKGFTDSGRVAVMGDSQGVFVAFHYAAGDPGVKSVAAIYH